MTTSYGSLENDAIPGRGAGARPIRRLRGELVGQHGVMKSVSDRLLLVAADLLRGELRSNDTVARLGEVEFGVLAVGTDQQNAAALIERLSTSAVGAAVSMTFEMACRAELGTLPAAYASAAGRERREDGWVLTSAVDTGW